MQTKSRDSITPTLLRACITCALGGLLFGFDTAVISGTTAAVKTVMSLTNAQLGFAVSSALIGTIIGSFAFAKPGKALGARAILRWLALCFLISALGAGLAWDFWSLAIFRFIGGLAIGGTSVFGPIYAAEIAPARLRGRLVVLFQYNVCLGVLLAFLSNALISTLDIDALHLQWRLMFAAGGIPAVFFGIMLYTIPESPRWLVGRGRLEEAQRVLVSVGTADAQQAISTIRQSMESSSQKAERLFQRKYIYPIFLGIAVAAFNQLSFVNGYLYYLNDTLAAIGASFGGKFQPLIIGIANVIAVTAALFVIDKIGRKKLLLIGSWGAAIPLALCAYIAWTHSLIALFPWSLATFILFFSFSQGAVIWVYVSEIFPNSVRAKGQSLGSFTHWGLCAVAAQVYPSVVAMCKGGLAIPFAFGSVMMILQFFIVWFFFVETKGITLEEIQKKLHIQ